MLVNCGFSEAEIEGWSWPKFRLRYWAAEEMRLQTGLITSLAVWEPKKAQERIGELRRLTRGLLGMEEREEEWENVSGRVEKMKGMGMWN